MPGRHIGKVDNFAPRGEIAAHGIQKRGLPFPLARRHGMLLNPDGQAADQQGDDQHDDKSQDVLGVGYGEGQVRGMKKKSNTATLVIDASTDGPRPQRVATIATPSR